jgi:hypothetical protein
MQESGVKPPHSKTTRGADFGSFYRIYPICGTLWIARLFCVAKSLELLPCIAIPPCCKFF